MNTITAAPAPAKAKGPLVWLDMDQQQLDDAYDQEVYAPESRPRRLAPRRRQRAGARRPRTAAARRLWGERIRAARHFPQRHAERAH